VYADSKDLFGVLLKTNQIDQRPIAIQLDQKVDVALGAVVASRDRAEYSNIPRAVASRGFPKSVPGTPEQ